MKASKSNAVGKDISKKDANHEFHVIYSSPPFYLNLDLQRPITSP